MLVAAPAFVLLGALAISETLDRAAKDLRTPVEGGDDAGAAAGGRGSDGGAKKKSAT